MSSHREIITLQIGHYANFVGSHLWNIQESSFVYGTGLSSDYIPEINHDVMFREGITLNREITYTPRLISLDLKDSLRSHRRYDNLYDVPGTEDSSCWDGDITFHKQVKIPKNEFLTDIENDEYEYRDEKNSACYDNEKDMDTSEDIKIDIKSKNYDLDNVIEVWSDFKGIHYHPKSILLLDNFSHNEKSEFSSYSVGFKAGKSPLFLDGFEDSLHFFLEECDNLQGINCMIDISDGFSGLGSFLLETLLDDLGKKCIFTSGVIPYPNCDPISPSSDYFLANLLQSYHCFNNLSSSFLPFSTFIQPWMKDSAQSDFTDLSYDGFKQYHSSALLASTLDSLLGPCRMADEHAFTSLSQLTSFLNYGQCNILSAYSCFPFNTSSKPLDYINNLHSLSPMCDVSNPIKQSLVFRGLSFPNDQYASFGQGCIESQISDRTYTLCNKFKEGLTIKHPFPKIFDRITPAKKHNRNQTNIDPFNLGSTPFICSLINSKSTHKVLDKMYYDFCKVNIKKHRMFDGEDELDDFQETLEAIQATSHAYKLLA